MDLKNASFAIIKHYNSPNSATTLDGDEVERMEQVYWKAANRMVACAPYDNHFVYVDPSTKKGRWNLMCTCGSPSIVAGYSAYIKDTSPTTKHQSSIPGELLVCYHHVQYGKHADGSG